MKEKTKIGYVSVKSLDEVRLFSGTVTNLYNVLKEEYEIVPVIIKKPLIFMLYDVICQKLHFSYYPRLLTKYYNKSFKRHISKLDSDVKYLFGCAISPIFGSNIDKQGRKLIYLSDAVFSNMVDYYWFDLSEQRKSALNELEKNSMRDSDHIIYSSKWSESGAINDYGVSKDKITIIPFPSPLEDEFEDNKSIEKEVIHMLFVGVDWKRKGTDVAIECVNELNRIDEKHKYILDIVGLQSENEYDNVIFHGKLMRNVDSQRKQLISLYKNADLFILPTKADCSPVVMSEAYQYGLPFISTRTGGVADLVIDGETGYLFELEDSGKTYATKIHSLVDNPLEYKRISDAARKRYENHHSRASWLREFGKIIEKLDGSI